MSRAIDPDASVRTIEKQIDAKRADIDRTLSALERQLSPSDMVDRGIGLVRENGGEVVQNLGRQFRDNPMPFLVTGIGMIWAMASPGGSRSSIGHYRSRYGYGDDDRGRDFDELDSEFARGTGARAGAEARFVSGESGSDFTPRYTDGSIPSTSGALASGLADNPYGDDESDDDGFLDSVRDGMDKLGNRLSGAADELTTKVSDMSDEARRRYEALSDDARSRYDEGRRRYAEMDADAREKYRTTRLQARQRRADWERGLRDGMDSLRANGQDMGRRARHQARSSADSIGDFVQEQPMVAAAIGAAIGAVIGALLPATRVENRYLGEYADEAKREARARAEPVVDQARERAERGVQQVSGMVEEASGTVRAKVEQAASEARGKAEEGIAKADRKASDATPA